MAFFYKGILSKCSSRKEDGSLRTKGSLTVESAVVLPVFFFAIVCLVSLLDLYRAEIILQSALCQGAKELGMYAYCTEEEESLPSGPVTKTACIAYGTRCVRDALEEVHLLGVKPAGIFLLDSEYREDLISLKATFFYRNPIPLFQNFPVKIQILGQARAWKGDQGKRYGNGAEEEIVYVTDWQSVYHTNRDCTHIRLKVQAVSAREAQKRKNEYEDPYEPCEKCCTGMESETVYITTSGDCYHSRRDCAGLTRHVRAVKKSETETMQICTRCKGE